MSLPASNTQQPEVFSLIEPLFIEHFKCQHGNTPSITELKQHLVSTNIDLLVEHLNRLNSHLAELASPTELARSIQAYIRKLK